MRLPFPTELTVCVMAFEGPDRYSQAGGLGVRVTHLAETLARRGILTHLVFVGDPAAAGHETSVNGFLRLHRWCQWISAFHPVGVYDGEEGKRRDFTRSAPPFIIEEIIRPALAAGRLPVVLAEEWHTADAVIRLHDLLLSSGLRGQTVLLWNANNTMGFHRLDWPHLASAAQPTTVSRYMKHLMRRFGVDPLVIPNGIPAELLQPVAEEQVGRLRRALDVDARTIFLFKAGRFDPAKQWIEAVEAAARLRELGYRVVFPLRGGIEPHGGEVLQYGHRRGLRIADVVGAPVSWDDVLSRLRAAGPADLYNLQFFLPQAWLRPFYAAADVVLAMSGHEPFGLVGLEAMAAGGLVFTGATGEEYTMGGQAAVALDTRDPEEIVIRLLDLRGQPDRIRSIRQAARRRAAYATWDRAADVLLDHVSFVAQAAGVIPLVAASPRNPSAPAGAPQPERV